MNTTPIHPQDVIDESLDRSVESSSTLATVIPSRRSLGRYTPSRRTLGKTIPSRRAL